MKSAEYYIKTIALKINSIIGPVVYRNWKIDLNKYNDPVENIRSSTVYYCLYDLTYHRNIDELYSFDKQGIPFKFKEAKKNVFNPLAVAHYLLSIYNKNYYNKEALPINFYHAFDYLISKSVQDQNGIYWQYNSEDLNSGNTGYFTSGITQSMILSLMLRIYALKPDEELKQLITQCYKTHFISVYKQGVLKFTREGYPWIEEYPLTGPRYVLNGFLFSIIALLEFEMTFSEITPIIPADEFLNSFIKKYPKFRVGNQIKYSLYRRALCNIKYKGLIGWQLYHLSKLTENKYIHSFLTEWASCVNWSYYKRVMHLKKTINPVEFPINDLEPAII